MRAGRVVVRRQASISHSLPRIGPRLFLIELSELRIESCLSLFLRGSYCCRKASAQGHNNAGVLQTISKVSVLCMTEDCYTRMFRQQMAFVVGTSTT